MNGHEKIVEKIKENGGCKASELAAEYDIINSFQNIDDFFAALDYLVASKEIIEIEYVQANMPQRIKSLYLPKGTKVNFVVEYELPDQYPNNRTGKLNITDPIARIISINSVEVVDN